jgi:hypothetical protein
MKILDASEPEFGGPMTEYEVRNFLVNSMKKESLIYTQHGIILTITMIRST